MNAGAKLLRRPKHFIQDWWFRGTAALLAGMIVGLVAGEANHSLRSLPWTISLMATSALASAWVLQTAGWARRRIAERQEGLRQLREAGQRLAIYDRETGLLAYWYFSLRLEEEVARCVRYGQTFSILLLEAHTGSWTSDDESALFRYMAESFRNCDLVAHLGNLRFSVLLTNTDAQGAMVVREHLRGAEQLREITVGIASFPADGDSCEALLTAAGASAAVVADSVQVTSTMKTAKRALSAKRQKRPRTAA